jgi:hypothetical protein
MSTVRCKFKLNTVTERLDYDGKSVWDAEMSAVYKGSTENETFFKYTPGGSFKVSTFKQMPWKLGGEYFIDITAAE